MDVIEDGVAVTDVIGTVKEVIVAAGMSQAQPGRDLRVAGVELTLHTVVTRSGGGGVDFRVPVLGLQLRLGRKLTRTDLHTVTISLVPPDLRDRVELRGVALQDALVEAIERIRAAVRSAATGDDPFELEESTVEMSFGVTDEGSIALGFEGNLSDDISHTLKLRLVAA
ncbi:trypco2 family protein [Nucisporomicrobium flavum]|uniref:trypco2 family protein n=1 Tax=Nucisporomicrobium flavum TaxID=2785915 RepID=UPI0018F5B3FD|nr:trypco2 family protein [Nucisporomicrobium flavum]